MNENTVKSKTKAISLRIPVTDHEQLAEACYARGTSPSYLLRMAAKSLASGYVTLEDGILTSTSKSPTFDSILGKAAAEGRVTFVVKRGRPGKEASDTDTDEEAEVRKTLKELEDQKWAEYRAQRVKDMGENPPRGMEKAYAKDYPWMFQPHELEALLNTEVHA